MKLPRSPTYYKSLELYTHALSERGITADLTLELSTSEGWSKAATGRKTVYVRQNLVVVEQGVLTNLSTNALMVVIHMMDGLKMNNALWYNRADSNYERKAIKELREKGLVLKTEDPHIHYINPLMVRRGSAAAVLAQTTELLRGISRVSQELIRDLNYKEVKFSKFDQLTAPDEVRRLENEQ